MINTPRMRLPMDVILVCIRWYSAYPLSYRHLEEVMQERGVNSPPQPFSQQPTVQQWRTGAGVGVRRLLDRLGLGRVGMDHVGQLAQPDAGHHRERYAIDHLTGMPGHDRCTQNRVG